MISFLRQGGLAPRHPIWAARRSWPEQIPAGTHKPLLHLLKSSPLNVTRQMGRAPLFPFFFFFLSPPEFIPCLLGSQVQRHAKCITTFPITSFSPPGGAGLRGSVQGALGPPGTFRTVCGKSCARLPPTITWIGHLIPWKLNPSASQRQQEPKRLNSAAGGNLWGSLRGFLVSFYSWQGLMK